MPLIVLPARSPGALQPHSTQGQGPKAAAPERGHIFPPSSHAGLFGEISAGTVSGMSLIAL